MRPGHAANLFASLTLAIGTGGHAAGASLPGGAGASGDAGPGTAASDVRPAGPTRGGAGFAVDRAASGSVAAALELPAGLRSTSPETPLYVRVTAGRAEIDDPGRLEPLLAEARARGLRVLVRIADADWEPMSAWFSRLQTFAQATGERVDAWQLFGPGIDLPAREYAYLLKNARVALRAAGAEGLLVSLPLGGDTAWAETLFAEDAAPYLDVLAAADLDGYARAAALRDRLHPRAPIWITDAPLGDEQVAAGAVRDYLEATAAGAEVIVLVPRSSEQAGLDGAVAAIVHTRGLFSPRLRPSAPGSLPFDAGAATESGGATPAAPVALRVLAFFDVETREGIAAYRPAPGVSPMAARLTLRAPVESLDLDAPTSDEVRRFADSAPAGAVLEIPLR